MKNLSTELRWTLSRRKDVWVKSKMETKKSVTKRKALSKWEAQEIVFTIEMRRGRDV